MDINEIGSKVFEGKIGVKVFLQHEEIFKTMHRI
mgnify:CR=1 FL=1